MNCVVLPCVSVASVGAWLNFFGSTRFEADCSGSFRFGSIASVMATTEVLTWAALASVKFTTWGGQTN